MRAQPTAQQRPKTFHGIHMYFTKAVAIFISGIFAPAMIDTLMCIAPSLKTCINAVLIRVNQGSWLNGVFDERLDGLLLDIGQQVDDHLSTTLNHAKDWRFFLRHCPSTGFAFASAPTAFAPRALDHLRLSLMTGHYIGFIALHFVGQDHCWLFFTMPPR